ncbi:hypothetical protein ACOTI0_27010, partial [Achromobacter ruhlandii]
MTFTVMFARFLKPGLGLSLRVGQLSITFVVLDLCCHLPWILAAGCSLVASIHDGRCGLEPQR